MKHLSCSKMIVAIAGLMLCGSLSYGDTEITPKLTITGNGSIEAGQVVKGSSILYTQLGEQDSNNVMLERIYTGVNFQTLFNPLPLEANFGLLLKTYRETPTVTNHYQELGQTSRLFYFMFLDRIDMKYTPNKSLEVQFGYFPFKYNENSRNLGEYLFRTGAYPQYIINDFDFSAARIAGLRVGGTNFNNKLEWNVLATINPEFVTIGDVNLTGIVSYAPFSFFKVGGGVQFSSLISSSINTSPKTPTNAYVKSISGTDTSFGYYTFAGTKLMARACIDPKEFLPVDLKNMLGTEDLKIYSEATILGLKNYPGSLDSVSDENNIKHPATIYNDIKKRIPIMFGFNIPTFKILDVFSMEFEWFGSTDPNDMTQVVRDGVPSSVRSSMIGYEDSTSDNWKWSIYAKKTLVKHFSITAQVANDHLRWEYNDYAAHANHDGVDALRATDKYYYIVKLGYNF